MNYWLDLFTGTTWSEFQEAGANVSGFRSTRQKMVERIKPGDILLCYLTGVMRWVGALEVVGPSKDERAIWKFDDFPARLDVKPLVLLNPEIGIPMERLAGKVQFYQESKDAGKFKGFLRGSPASFARREDGDLILQFLEEAKEHPINTDSIRQMFNGSDLSWKPSKLVHSVKLAPESHGQHLDLPLVGIVIEPKELCSFAVFLPSLNANDSANIVYLPGISDDCGNFYKQLELNQKPNEKCTVVYPTRIRLHDPDTNGCGDLSCKIQFDISNPSCKGCANNLYQTFTKLDKSDIQNMSVQIRSTIKSNAVDDINSTRS
jgi:hypothetical protein